MRLLYRKMMGKQYSRDEISQTKALIDEGLSNREIASKLGRPEAGIRNLRYRQGLKKKSEAGIEMLLEQKDMLGNQVSELRRKKTELLRSVESLEKRKETVETILGLDKFLLRSTFINVLTRLRVERPELFVLNEQEQNNLLMGLILKWVFS